MNLKTTDQLPIDPITQQHSGKQHQDSQHHRPGAGCPLRAQDRVRRNQHPRHGFCSISRLAGSSNATSFITNSITTSASRRNTVICQLGLSGNIIR